MKNKSGQLNRPTPETDAFAVKFKSVCGSKSWVPTDISRRFERERDEAREQVKELIYIAGRAIDLAEIDFENDKFGVVSELRGGLEKIKEEQKEIDRVNRSWGKSTK